MHSTDNTFLITGGGSGIGRALAESFHALGNKVIIAGRRQSTLDDVTRANPGMASLVLDVGDPHAIERAAAQLVAEHPTLNAVIHNAGIMKLETISGAQTAVAEATIATNLLGPIRLTAALLPHLLEQPNAAIVTVTSGLAFVPRASFPTYCATKAALHSYTQSLRHQLRDTAIQVIELAPPYMQTELAGPHQAVDPAAMPLKNFIAEAMQLLTQSPDVDEILVERVKPLRFAERDGTHAQIFNRLAAMPAAPATV
jgi:uncharacterized oxidoreductase